MRCFHKSSTVRLLAISTITALMFGCSSQTQVPAPPARPSIAGTWLYTGGPLKPSNGEDVPLTPWAAERLKQQRISGQDFRDTTDPSLLYADPNGYPRISMHPMRFKLLVTDDYVYQLWEYNQNWRQITLNKPHSEDLAPAWYGDAVGKWEGDTLVVDSTGYKDTTWLDSQAHPHSESLHIVERIHRSADTLLVDLTFDDPKAFTKPWSSQLKYKLAPDGSMTETIYTISDELRFRERFLNQKATIPIRR